MNRSRRKLLNAILFFAKNTRNLNTTKLCKLLFFLDFTHFKQTGFPVVGLDYHAFEKGPVPKFFWIEIKEGVAPADFKKDLKIQILSDSENDYKELRFTAQKEPELRVFTPREQKIMSDLAEIYRDATAVQLSEITHLKNTPWYRTYNTAGLNSHIDYNLAIDEEALCEKTQAEEQLREFFAVNNNFSISPTK